MTGRSTGMAGDRRERTTTMADSDNPGGGRHLRYAIIGAGMAGILAGIKLNERGETDYTIYEKGDSVGGTWRENRYPGLTCDVPSHVYTYTFAPNPDWSRFFAAGPEIKGYFQRIADDYAVSSHIRFNAEVVSCRYQDGRWHLETVNGLKDVADVVIVAAGVLHHPRYPDIEGLDSFKGPCFHTARWDDSVSLDGKRVGIIGNGSTGVQIVAAVTPKVSKLVQFQRSAQWIMATEDFAYTPEERADFRAHPEKLKEIRLHGEFWTFLAEYNRAVLDPDSPQMKMIEDLAAKNLEEKVADLELREKLRPGYRAGCRRLIISPNYYEEIQKPHATLETKAILRVEPNGVRMVDGSFHELDVLVLATGFKTDRFIRPTEVIGRNGRSLDDAWEDRPQAYYSISVPDFPNFFMINGPAAPIGNFALIDVAEKQWGYIDQLVDLLRSGQAKEVAATSEAASDYEQRRIDAAKTTIFATGCISWYLDKDGVPLMWPWSYELFIDEMVTPKLEDYELA
jgi:cation diffusion facilitator CzcD-associated flavoprotein CzcO